MMNFESDVTSVEMVIEEIEKNVKQIDKLQDYNKLLVKNLKERPTEDWDWVSVSTACKKWDISPAKMYDRISRGDIMIRKFDNKIYVSLREVMNIDDSRKVAE